MQLGTSILLTASAQNSSNGGLRPVFTYAISPSSPAGVLDIASNGFACAGTWNAPSYTICTPGNTGLVEVTASALGETSPPTLIFVHAHIDNIQVSLVPPINSPPPACPAQQALPNACQIPFNSGNCTTQIDSQGQPYTSCKCLSQNQVETLQANAYSQGNDITAQVGPFIWIQATQGVATVTPIVNTTYNVATNQATASPGTPGATQVIASASGVYSQPYNLESCPVQCIALQLSVNGQYVDQTNFVASKGTTETIAATAVDVQGCIVPKPALTWVSSQPAALALGSATATCSTATTCAVSTPQPGAAAITASCTPPTCNVGFPLNLANLPAPYIPQPVYPVTAISGLVTGAANSTSVLATSQDCYSDILCTVALFSVSTSTNLPGAPNGMPAPPNSLMFDPAGDTAFAGGEFGALVINPANLTGATNTSPFTALPAPGTPLGLVTGKILAVSPSGHTTVFSDTVSTPNQVYVVTAAPSSTTPLNINSATAAAFSPDGSEVFILGDGGNTLYVYSPLQYLQTLSPGPLPTPATSITFNSTGSFALLSGGSPAGSLAFYRTCDNSLVTPYQSAPAILTPPLFLKMVPSGGIPQGNLFGGILIPNLQPAGLDFFLGLDDTGIDIIATTSSQPPLAALCPQQVTLAQTTANATFPPVHINLNQGTFHPINFFVSPDSTRAYIVTSDFGIFVYNFNTNSVSTKIGLINDATPVAADMTVDGTLIYVAGSDGLLHQINTILGVDLYQTSFVPLPNSSNNFCYTGPDCHLNLVAVKP
jgi:WD40 repeat protein